VNYYRRFPGDYARDTAHLSLTEHGAYALLLDYLYGTQRVLPGNDMGLFRVCGAHTEEEKAAVLSVIRQFFEKTADGYTQSRATEEIKQAESRINAARENGKKGGRPTQQKPTGFQSANPQESSPSSNHQTPDKERVKIVTAPAEPIQTKRATPFLDGFQLDPEMILFGNEQGVDPIAEFDAFRDYHKSRGSTFKDWKAAWRYWVRNSKKFEKGKGQGNANANVPKSFDAVRREKTDAAARRVIENNRGIGVAAGAALPARVGRV